MRELSIRQRRTHWDTSPKGQSLSQSQRRIVDTIPQQIESGGRAPSDARLGDRHQTATTREMRDGEPLDHRACLIATCYLRISTCITQLPAPSTSTQSAISQNTSKHTVLHQARHYKIASTSGRLSGPKSAYRQTYRFQP